MVLKKYGVIAKTKCENTLLEIFGSVHDEAASSGIQRGLCGGHGYGVREDQRSDECEYLWPNWPVED